jgi:TatD DNase family protein
MLIDSHCHFPHKKYIKNIDEILSEAKEAGVEKFISIGTSLKENLSSIEIAEKYKEVYSTIGIYPHVEMDKELSFLEKSLQEQIKLSNKIVGIGECGIDVSELKGGRKIQDQIEIFEMQLQLASKNNLPVCIHNRNGDVHILNTLTKFKQNLTGVFHCFSSSWDFAKQVLDLGFDLSFSGFITYPGKDMLLEVVKKVPEDRFLLETDSPYLPPQGHRGEVNYPKYVRIVAEKASQIKEKSFEEICELSSANTCRLFKI